MGWLPKGERLKLCGQTFGMHFQSFLRCFLSFIVLLHVSALLPCACIFSNCDRIVKTWTVTFASDWCYLDADSVVSVNAHISSFTLSFPTQMSLTIPETTRAWNTAKILGWIAEASYYSHQTFWWLVKLMKDWNLWNWWVMYLIFLIWQSQFQVSCMFI